MEEDFLIHHSNSLNYNTLKNMVIKNIENIIFAEKPLLIRDRKFDASGSDLSLHSGVLALPEFRIRTRKQFTQSGNCWAKAY
jgi:hypothetical protein